MPRVSVVMVAHEGNAFLDAAVRSILIQMYDDFELVVVDDASDGESVSRAVDTQNTQGRVVRIVRMPERRGPYTGANAGIAVSTGEIIVRHDSDDESKPLRLRMLVDAFDSEPSSLAAIASDAELIDEAGVAYGRRAGPATSAEVARTAPFAMPICHPTLAVRRSVLEHTRYRSEFFSAGDFDLVARLVERTTLAVLPVALYRYRAHAGSMTATQSKLQEASRCVVMWTSARRRRGSPERLGDTLTLARDIAEQATDRNDVRRVFVKILIADGCHAEAAWLARDGLRDAPTWETYGSLTRAIGQGLNPSIGRAVLRKIIGAPLQALLDSARGST